ncbi:hypothetical protein [Flavobacterium sp.]|uniref:hypothetical protein n=1 Tax=Flavobacteriaceae TaxID=49546 RepID=UPI004047A588
MKKTIIIIVASLLVQTTVVYAQASTKFEEVFYVNWESGFSNNNISAMIVLDPLNMEGETTKGTIRLIHPYSNGLVRNFNANVYVKVNSEDGLLRVFIEGQKNPKETGVNSHPYSFILSFKDDYFDSGITYQAHQTSDKGIDININWPENASQEITLIDKYFTNKDELYSELRLNAYYKEELNKDK